MTSSWSLTSEQEAVVVHPLEPVRIAAGAGTGKTSTIVQRLVACIDDGMAPEAALGITFTNKAAEELADRLRSSLLGYAVEGREVEVTTYHGFAYSLLQEYGAFVGIERDADVIGPGFVRQLLLESLQGRRYTHLDMTSPPHRVDEAATLAGQLGDNLVPAEDLLTAPKFRTGPVWDQRRELAEIVVAYEAEKRRLGVVDYADLIRAAHQLVTEHPDVAARVRERYRLVLLDEYQDTAPAQRELLRTIFGGGFPVTAVGDADQTIYEWRGASLANFEGFPGHFAATGEAPATTLPLTVNHRSGTSILALANAVRAELHGDTAFAPLVAATGTTAGDVSAWWFNDAVREAEWLASEVRRLHDEDDTRWRDIAILFRKNRHIALIRDALEREGVPVEVASLGGLLDVPEVADLHAWLRVLEYPDDSPALLRILLGSRYRLGLGDLAPLTAWLRAEQPDDRGDRDERTWPLIEAIDRLDDVTGLRPEAHRRLGEFRDTYRRLLIHAQGVALDELCRRVLDAISAWADVESMEPAASLSARLNLYRFLDLAQGWSPLEGRTSLAAFLGYLELLADEGRADELDTARVGGEDAVTLLTVHRAKGLEWDHVFLPALTRGTFPATSQGFDNPEDYPRYLPYDLRLDAHTLPALDGSATDRKDRLRARHVAAEWRTAYVAVTRARHRLYLSGAFWHGGKKPVAPSRLFEIATEQENVEIGAMLDAPGEAPARLTLGDIEGAPDPLFPDGWQSALRATMTDGSWPAHQAPDRPAYDAKVEQLQMLVDGLPTPPDPEATDTIPGTSVTGLVTLAGCPKRFYWSEIDRLPRRPGAWLKRGIEVHRQIELHNLGRIAFDELDTDLYDVAADEGEGASPTGDAVAAFRASRFADARPRFVETPIDMRIGEARIRGRIDAIYEPEPGSWEIVDFKSGRKRDDAAAVVQLEAYAIAAVDGAVGVDRPDQITVTFAYLGSGALEEISIGVDDAWLDGARRRLESLVAQMAGDDFLPTPSLACARCDFLSFCDEGTRHVASLE